MDIGKQAYLAQYYLNNLFKSKIFGLLARRRVEACREQWAALREAHAGHCSWLVVGNGPSLTIADLEALAHLPSIASNKINLLFDKTNWRPTLYTIGDPLLLFKLPTEHYNDFPLTLTPHTSLYLAKSSQLLPWKNRLISDGEAAVARAPFKPDPVERGLIDGRTITAQNLQLAMWMGAKRIYLIGCDHFYKEKRSPDRAKVRHEDSVSNHFHKDYRKPGELVNAAPIDMMERGYRLQRAVSEANGVKIVNISRRTALSIFDRAEVEDAVAATTT